MDFSVSRYAMKSIMSRCNFCGLVLAVGVTMYDRG